VSASTSDARRCASGPQKCQDRRVGDTSSWRHVARATAYGTFGALGAAAATAGLLRAQAEQAKRTIGVRSTSPPYADGRYGKSKGPSIRMVMVGDSLATSLGADDPLDTIGARLASLVAEYDGRAVVLSTVAEVSAQSKELAGQVDRALHYRPHVAVIIIGGNDATHLVPHRQSIKLLDSAVRRLRQAGTQVVVGTTPDLGTVVPIHPPLGWILRRSGRTLARAQAICVVEAEGRAVHMGSLLGPEFDLRPEDLFSADQFHPSTEGYEAVAQALAPSVIASLSLGEKGEILPEVAEPRIPTPMLQLEATAHDHDWPQLATAVQRQEPTSRWRRWTRIGRGDRSPAETFESSETPVPAMESELSGG
jgi:lysophospholipase L1-like esterase